MTLPVNLPRAVKGTLGFAKTCNKSHSLCSSECLSLALPNDHLCWDLSGHSTAHCAFAGQPLTALTLLPHLHLASQEPQVWKGCFALMEIRRLPLLVTSVFAVQFQPLMRRVFESFCVSLNPDSHDCPRYVKMVKTPHFPVLVPIYYC